ncbi:Histone-binding protein N1/N2-like protein [Drosera capensis]
MATEPSLPPAPSESDAEQPQTTIEPESSLKDAGSADGPDVKLPLELADELTGMESAAVKEGAFAADGPDVKLPLELAAELTGMGSAAVKEGAFEEATDCFSRALEIRVAHYGELAPECVNAYYKYGSALLYKAQEEADPFGAMPKKDTVAQQNSDKGISVESDFREESVIVSESSVAEKNSSSKQPEEAVDNGPSEKNEEEGDEDEVSDADDLGEANEDESDLDLAWKMLDLARAIAEKQSGDTMEKVDILSALAEVALEREDIDTSLSDYLKALSILERLVGPDNRRIAELNFRICLCLEIGSKAEEAIPYCQKAISVCKSRVQRLTDELKSSSGPASEINNDVDQSSVGSLSYNSGSDKQAEIETLTGLANLQQLVSNPKSILSDIMGMMMAKQKGGSSTAPSTSASSSQVAAGNSNGSFDSSSVSTVATNGTSGVTHLGVVGRGVKRVGATSMDVEPSPAKRTAADAKDEGNGS